MMAQRIMDGTALSVIAGLFLFKFILVVLTLWAGAYGGVLTPSFALGTALGMLFVTGIGMVVPRLDPHLAMLVGASSFLSVSMSAPLAATGIVIGFTAQDPIMIIPVLLASIIAYYLSLYCIGRQSFIKPDRLSELFRLRE